MKNFKKIGYFIMMVLCIIGAIGGIGYAIFCGSWVVVIGVAVLTYTAWPKFYDYILGLML